MPGIIGERFFSVLDLNGDGYIDVKEFIHGFFKVYYSNLETKIKLAFDMYINKRYKASIGMTSTRTAISKKRM